jgi:hypothetical protein
MKIMRLLLVSFTLLLLTSCSSWRESMRNSRIADEFVTTSKGYVRMIRWHEFDKSTLFYVDDTLREDFQKRVSAIEQLKVVDYRIKNLECWPKKGKAEVTVEWDYYMPPSVTVKTVTDPQKWRYVEEENRTGWLLTTLLPEFK